MDGDKMKRAAVSNLFQAVQEPDPGHRAGTGNSRTDAGLGPIAGLLLGDDLCRFPGGSQPGQQESGNAAVFDDQILHVPATSASASVPARDAAHGVMNPIRPKHPRLRLDADAYQQLCRHVLERDGWKCQGCWGNATTAGPPHAIPQSLRQ